MRAEVTACVCRALWNAMRLKPDTSTLGNTATLAVFREKGLSTAKGTPSLWTASAREKPPRPRHTPTPVRFHRRETLGADIDPKK